MPLRRARPLLGTIVQISVTSSRDPAWVHGAIDVAFERVAHVHALMSYQNPDSELSRLNRCAARVPQQIDPHTATVLRAALRIAQDSLGAFDPTVSRRVDAPRHVPEPTPSDRITSACWRDVELLDDGRVRYCRPLHLDLGGIAKGFAVDLAAQSLLDHGLHDFVVNAGGDLRVGGVHAVAIRDPARPAAGARCLTLQDQALATSAAYFSGAAQDSPGNVHLVDPGLRAPYRGGASVSVVADACMVADALTKVVLFATPETAERVLDRQAARAVVLGASAAA